MGNEDTIQQSLALAPPEAPTAAEAQADKTAATAAQLSDSLTPKTTARPAEVKSAPDAGNLGARPGSFAQRIGDAFNLLSRNGVQPSAGTLFAAVTHAFTPPEKPSAETAPTTKTGPWANALASDVQSAPAPRPSGPGRVNDAVQGVLRQIGDIKPAEGGVLGGFAQTARVTSEREAQEKKDRQLMATSNAQMLREQALTHKSIEDEIRASVAEGKAAADTLTSAPPGGEAGTEDFKDLTSDDLNAKIKSGEIDPTKQTPFLTGRKLVGKDANGLPTYRSTYTVVTPPKQVLAATDKQLQDIKYYTGTDLKTEDGTFIPVSGVRFNDLLTRAAAAKVTERKLLATEATEGKQIADEATRQAALTISQNPTVQKVLNMKGVIASADDPYARVKAFNMIMNRPDLLAEIQKTVPDFADTYIKSQGGNEAWKTQVEAYEKAQAKNSDTIDGMIKDYTEHPDKISGHTPAVKAAALSIINDPEKKGTQQQADAQRLYSQALATESLENDLQNSRELNKEEQKQKAQQRASALNNPQGLTGEAFIRTLPPGRANTLRAFSNGLMVLNPTALERTEKGQAYLDDVYTAYPDLDATKAPTYAKLRQGFTSGPQSIGINASNTVLHHLNLMDKNLGKATAGYTGSVEQFFGANPAGRQVADDAIAIANELGRLYTGGVVAQEEKGKWEEKLNPKGFGMTVNKLRTNVQEFTRLLGGKLEAFQDQWDDGVPSALIPAPKQIASQESIETYKRLTGEDMKVHPTQKPVQTHAGKAADGTPVWQMSDGTVQDAQGNKYDSTGKRM